MESGGKGACLDACIDGYFDIWCSTDFEYTGSHRLQIWNLWFLLFCRIFYLFSRCGDCSIEPVLVSIWQFLQFWHL